MELITSIFTGPVLPATCFLGFLVIWSLMAILGAVDLDLPNGDIDFDLDLDASSGLHASDGLSVLVLRWLNVRDLPLVLWLGTFAVTWWFISATLWTLVDTHFFSPTNWLWTALLVTKNVALAIPITKIVTNPMTKWFVTEQLSAASLVGQECEISSLSASAEFGQVKYKTDGSPLLLNVRTDGPHLVRGTRVWITHYDAKRRLYIVSPTGTHGDPTLSAAEEE